MFACKICLREYGCVRRCFAFIASVCASPVPLVTCPLLPYAQDGPEEREGAALPDCRAQPATDSWTLGAVGGYPSHGDALARRLPTMPTLVFELQSYDGESTL